MAIINTKLDDTILTQFRDTIYHMSGLKRGDFKKSLEIAMIDYIVHYSNSEKGKKYAIKAKEALLQ
jgi:hypothetical protein